MSKCNTKTRLASSLRNYRIAALYARKLTYRKIAKIIGCSRSCVAGVVRWHVKQVKRDHQQEYWMRLEDSNAPALPSDASRVVPSVAYVRGLEAYSNPRYIMRSMDNG